VKRYNRWDLLFARGLQRMMRNPKTKFDEREFVTKGSDYLFNYAEKNVGPIDEGRRNFMKALAIGVGAAAVAGLLPGLRVPCTGCGNHQVSQGTPGGFLRLPPKGLHPVRQRTHNHNLPLPAG